MAQYQGQALVVAPNGEQVDVAAFLFSIVDPVSGLASWGGRVRTTPPASVWSAFDAGRAELRIGDRTGEVIITSYGDDSSELQGSGPAPF